MYQVKVPHRLLELLGIVNVMAARVTGYPPMLTPGKIRHEPGDAATPDRVMGDASDSARRPAPYHPEGGGAEDGAQRSHGIEAEGAGGQGSRMKAEG